MISQIRDNVCPKRAHIGHASPIYQARLIYLLRLVELRQFVFLVFDIGSDVFDF